MLRRLNLNIRSKKWRSNSKNRVKSLRNLPMKKNFKQSSEVTLMSFVSGKTNAESFKIFKKKMTALKQTNTK